MGLYPVTPFAGKVDSERIRGACIAGGQWLMRTQKDDGSFCYRYYPLTDEYEKRKYNIVRHAGTTYSLAQLYMQIGDAAFLSAAHRAAKFLSEQIIKPGSSAQFAYVRYDNKVKLGGTALAVIAFLELCAIEPEPQCDILLKKLGNFIIFMQKEDGSFHSHYYNKEGTRSSVFTSRYYPGEATLALTRLYRQHNEKKWLDAALKAADYLVRDRDTELKLKEPLRDQWLMMALSELYPISGNRAYADYCFKIADTMIKHQYQPETSPYEHYTGGVDNLNPPHVCAAATNCEGLVAAWRLAREMKLPTERYGQAMLLSAKFQLRHQFTPETTHCLPNPARAVGGFRANSIKATIRIDYVQHNISALLGVLQVLSNEITSRL